MNRKRILGVMLFVFLSFGNSQLWASTPEIARWCSLMNAEHVLDQTDPGPQVDGDIVLLSIDDSSRSEVRVEYKHERCVRFSFPQDATTTMKIYNWQNQFCAKWRAQGEALLKLSLEDIPEVAICFDVRKLLAEGENRAIERDLYPDLKWIHFYKLLAVVEKLGQVNRFTESLLVYQQAKKYAPSIPLEQRVAKLVSQMIVPVGDEVAYSTIVTHLQNGKVPDTCQEVWRNWGDAAMSSDVLTPLPYLQAAKACGLAMNEQNLATLTDRFNKWLSGEEMRNKAEAMELLTRQSVPIPICFTTDELYQLLIKWQGKEPQAEPGFLKSAVVVLEQKERLREAFELLQRIKKSRKQDRPWLSRHQAYLEAWLVKDLVRIDDLQIAKWLTDPDDILPPFEVMSMCHHYSGGDCDYDDAIQVVKALGSATEEEFLDALRQDYQEIDSSLDDSTFPKTKKGLRRGIVYLLGMHYLQNQREAEALQLVQVHLHVPNPADHFDLLAKLAASLAEEYGDKQKNYETAIRFLKKSLTLEWTKEKAERLARHYMQFQAK